MQRNRIIPHIKGNWATLIYIDSFTKYNSSSGLLFKTLLR